ncbi:hypothetical protein FE257_006607 [Aspergillus nanangensis]|uniref:GST N-terminal domain-containing protein n=1 Tax=Aspergillus nanangensis TaxID=2582783 RepID=A0AAD4GZ53_ASPNN|nr:hypothetical protein FE257_006607 [Aspergillus nanangensis]
MNVFEDQRGQITLYAPPGSRNGATIAILLEELKLPYRLRVASKGEEVEAAPVPLQARNSSGLPLLTNFQSDGEHVSICGAEAILEYLLERYDEDYRVSYPKDSSEYREMIGWLDLVFPHVNRNQEASPARFNMEAVDDGIAFARKALSLYLNLEQHLQKTGTRYLVGNKCTIADFAHFPYVAAAGDTGLDLESEFARDLARPVHGTWLGISKQGRLAILTNFHEVCREKAIGRCSRGEIVNSWLTQPAESTQTVHDFLAKYTSDGYMTGIGGFNLICGNIMEPLAVLSNRSSSAKEVHWVADQPGQTVGVSNTSFDDRSWAKVVQGEKNVARAIEDHVGQGEEEDALVQRLLGAISIDTLPRLDGDAELEAYMDYLPESVFVPTIGRPETREGPVDNESPLPGAPDGTPKAAYFHGLYGTQKQTVVLVAHDGRVRFFERTLFDQDSRPESLGSRDISFEFVCEK